MITTLEKISKVYIEIVWTLIGGRIDFDFNFHNSCIFPFYVREMSGKSMDSGEINTLNLENPLYGRRVSILTDTN